MKRILVTGANGQLGSEIFHSSLRNKNILYEFTDVNELDITNKDILEKYFTDNEFDLIINCAAYTAVDKAESEIKNAENLNVLGPGYLADFANRQNARLIHISTDFVYDGNKNVPYQEEDATLPLSVYGATKLNGENEIIRKTKDYLIIRTSWLYSEYGQNFVKSMIKFGKERAKLNVVFDQLGTPTYAKDLAEVIIMIVQEEREFKSGIYHYSNEGVASWYDFAWFIIHFMNVNCEVNPILTSQYPTPAIRPAYSVLNKSKIKTSFGIKIPYWQESLERCLMLLKNDEW